MARLTARELLEIQFFGNCQECGENVRLASEVLRLQALLCGAWNEMTLLSDEVRYDSDLSDVKAEVEAIQAEARAQREGE